MTGRELRTAVPLHPDTFSSMRVRYPEDDIKTIKYNSEHIPGREICEYVFGVR